MVRLAWAAALALLVSACASNVPDAPVAVDNQQSCTREAQLGSNVPMTRCRDKVQAAQERKAAEDAADALRRAPVRPAGGVAGPGS